MIAKLRWWVFVPVAIVSGAGVSVELWHYVHPDAVSSELLPRLSLSFESNVPTWLSSSLLLLCAIAAGRIASSASAARGYWWGIAVGLAYVSLDEASELHEHLGGLFGTGGLLYFDWVLVAGPVVAVLALVYLRFILALPPVTRMRLVVAAIVYVSGALLLELPLGLVTERSGPDSLAYVLIDWVEETMELVGAGLALVALVEHRD